MKKLLGILVLGLLLISSPANAGTIGSGELKISEGTFNAFLKYLRGGTNKMPEKFLVTLDGEGSYYWYCGHGTCVAGGDSGDIKVCELHWDRECKVFAKRRTIRWKNGINKGGKQGKINSKWSDSEIRAKLTELGFMGETTSTSTATDNTKYPKSRIEWTSERKENWKDLMLGGNEKNKAWADVISSKNKEYYSFGWWATNSSLDTAVRKAIENCKKFRKKSKFKKYDICIVHYINGKATTDKQKIKYAEQYYGKELADKTFEKNSWLLSDSSNLEISNKTLGSGISDEIKELKKLHEEGILTDDEFKKAKKKILSQ